MWEQAALYAVRQAMHPLCNALFPTAQSFTMSLSTKVQWQMAEQASAACLCRCDSCTHQIAEEALLGAAAWLERLEGPESLLHGD